MSMLPEVVLSDEFDPIHEMKFFSILHQDAAPTDSEDGDATSQAIPKSYETIQITVSQDKRVIGKNYSYPLYLDPALYAQEVYD